MRADAIARLHPSVDVRAVCVRMCARGSHDVCTHLHARARAQPRARKDISYRRSCTPSRPTPRSSTQLSHSPRSCTRNLRHNQPPRSCRAAHTRAEYDAAIAFSKLLDTVARCTR